MGWKKHRSGFTGLMAPLTGFNQSLDLRGSRDGVLSSLASPKGLYSTAASPQERLLGGGLVLWGL